MDYPDTDALPQSLKETLATHAPVNVYRMVMHSPGLAPGFFIDGRRHVPSEFVATAPARAGHPSGGLPLRRTV